MLRIESFSKRDPMDRSKPFPKDVKFVNQPFTCEIDTWWLGERNPGMNCAIYVPEYNHPNYQMILCFAPGGHIEISDADESLRLSEEERHRFLFGSWDQK